MRYAPLCISNDENYNGTEIDIKRYWNMNTDDSSWWPMGDSGE